MKKSAGILLYRLRNGTFEVLLVHPGGPYYRSKDDGVWSIPKGECQEGEDAFTTATREFYEETHYSIQDVLPAIYSIDIFQKLQPVQCIYKTIIAWAVEGDCDASKIKSNLFTLEWPPHSGKQQQFPEVDRASWFPLDIAYQKISKTQIPFLHQLGALLL